MPDIGRLCFDQSLTYASGCAVRSLVELYALQYELQEPPDTEGSLATALLADAFSRPEVLVASFGRAKQPFTPGCGALHEHSTPISKAKDSPTEVLRLLGCFTTAMQAALIANDALDKVPSVTNCPGQGFPYKAVKGVCNPAVIRAYKARHGDTCRIAGL